MRYRKKPIEVDALEWTGHNVEEMDLFAGDCFVLYDEFPKVYDKLHDTWIWLKVGDYIIRGIEGELYPCVRSVFELTYEPAGVEP